MNELRATVARAVAGECLVDLVRGDIEVEPDSDGSKGIGQIVVADELGLYFPSAHLEDGAGPGEVEEEALSRAGGSDSLNVGLGARPVADALRPEAHLAKYLVLLVVEEDTIPGTYAVVELALGATDALERTEAFEMRLPDVGDQAIVGLGDSA